MAVVTTKKQTLAERREEEKDRVLRYVREKGEVDEEQIANDLNLHLIDVQVALITLEKEEKMLSRIHAVR